MNISKKIFLFFCLSIIWVACTEEEIQLPLEETIHLFNLEDYLSDNRVLDQTVDSIYLLMNEDDRYGQVISLSSGAGTLTREELSEEITQNTYGGAVFLGSNKNLKDFTAELQSATNWPLLLSLDAEPSLINGRLADLKQKFEHTSETANDQEAAAVSLEIAEILSGIGISQNYAPVSDFGSNTSVINKRSYGGDIDEVISRTNAFIREHQSRGVVSTAKHFPGHGSAKGDSHKKLVSIPDVNEELEVFKSNIKQGVLSVMVGHIAVENGTYATSNHPSSISGKVVTDLLRNKLAFKGLIVTDAMNMKGVTQFENADLKALQAGIDMVLMPSDPHTLKKQIKREVLQSKLFADQIKASVKRVIRLKVCLGLFTEDHIKTNRNLALKKETPLS